MPSPPSSAEHSEDDYSQDELDDSEEDEFEEDRARTNGVAVWADDDQDEDDESEGGTSGHSEDEDEDEEAELGRPAPKGKGKERELARLQNDLRTLPLSTLLKAQRTLPSGADSESDDEDQAQSKAARVAEAREKLAALMRSKKGGKEIADETGEQKKERERRERVKRDNKHAPMEISSKRQVSRKREVVEVGKVERRDPRFSSLSGQIDPHLHSKAYAFLPSLLSDEHDSLRSQLKAAQKALSGVPRAERAAKEAEVERLEVELSRVRTRKEKEERVKRERDALQTWKKDERAKRGEGKGEWHLKDSEKRRILAEAKHSALLAKGGQFAVKKAIEKKRKKDAGKEKKARPRGLGFGQSVGSGVDSTGARKRVRM